MFDVYGLFKFTAVIISVLSKAMDDYEVKSTARLR